MVTAAYYPVNDTSLSAGERAYLQQLEAYAEHQDLEQDLRPETRILSLAFTVLAAFVVGLRFLARQRQHAPYGVDDWLILVALALLGGNLAFNMVMTGEGLGLHSGRLTIEELMKLNQTVVGAEIIYTTGVNMYKISLLFLYFRIFPLPSIRKWGLVCGGISTAWNIACIFAAAFQCLPRHKIWEPWIDGYCIDLFLTQLCISVPSILCDMAILCFPLPHILRLRTNRTQKAFLVVIFMLGSYVVFTSIYRFVIYLSYTHADIPYSLAIPCAWNVIEISSGIISSCLPTLGPIVRPLIKSVMPSSPGASSYGRRRTGGSRGLVTIGGGGGDAGGGHSLSRRSKAGKWDHCSAADMAHDIEMGPTTVISAERSGDAIAQFDSDGSPPSAGTRRASGGGGADGRGSDEYPIMKGIKKTVLVEWTVEEQNGGNR